MMNNELSLVIIDPYRNEVPQILRPFNYKMRVRLARVGCPEWLSYLDKGIWDSELTKALEVMRDSRKIMAEEYRQKILNTQS